MVGAKGERAASEGLCPARFGLVQETGAMEVSMWRKG